MAKKQKQKVPDLRKIRPSAQVQKSYRQRILNLVKRMERDYERELRPLIREMQEQRKSPAEQRGFKPAIDAAVEYVTLEDVAKELKISRDRVLMDYGFGKITGAIRAGTDILIPTESVRPYGERIGVLQKPSTVFDRFTRRMEKLQQKYRKQTKSMEGSVRASLNSISTEARRKFKQQFADYVGVNVMDILAEQGLDQYMQAKMAENVSLIRSVPSDYFERIQQIVNANLAGEGIEGGPLRQIQKLTGLTRKRAKLIAHDQASKTMAGLTQIRQQNVGITHYIWRTQKGVRVAGNPAGKYPPTPQMERSTAHGNHWKREGKVFAWDDPPPDGHPGQPINCMCWAEPIIPGVNDQNL